MVAAGGRGHRGGPQGGGEGCSSSAAAVRNHPCLLMLRLLRLLQAKLDALDCGRRFVDCDWHEWEDPAEGGAPKPSLLL